MQNEVCYFCIQYAGAGIIYVPDASEYCETCGIGACIHCVEAEGLVKDETDNVYYCEECMKASLPKRKPVVATVTLAGYDEATRCAVESVVEPRTGSRVHQREVER